METNKTQHTDEEEKDTNYERLLWKWGKCILLIWVGYIMILQFLAPWVKAVLFPEFKTDKGFDYGAFGDTFGALNALFAGLAFAGLIVTIRQQAKDLRATREEMRNNNKEFSKQTLETALFQYVKHMHSVRPDLHQYRIERILNAVEDFNRFCKGYYENRKNPLYWRSILQSINIIRDELKEYATWRRTFSDWCIKIKEEAPHAVENNEIEQFVINYQSRLWRLFSHQERRVLFMQFAFYINAETDKNWIQHESLASKTKCMERFARNFNKKSYNALLKALHLSGPREKNYALSPNKLKRVMWSVYINKSIKYQLPKEEKRTPKD